MIFKRLIIVMLLAGTFSTKAFAAAKCSSLLENPILIAQTFVDAQMDRFKALPAAAQKKLGRTNVEFVLRDEESPLVRQALMKLIDALKGAESAGDVERVLSEQLTHRVPSRQIKERIAELREGEPTTLQRALAYRTLAETQELIYGEDPKNPAPESLLGLYLQETGASHLMRRYARGATPEEGAGAPKLTIALNPAQRKTFLKYFDIPELLMHYHTPGQGTLLIFFNGTKWSYAGSSQSGLSANSFTDEGLLLPFILLSSSEANRMANYIELGMLNGGLAKQPWNLAGYCAKGGYNSCTHWFGEIPLGDKKVKSYSFPGNVDQYASGEVRSPRPQRQILKPYWNSRNFQTQIQNQSRANPAHPSLRPSDPGFGDLQNPQRLYEVVERLVRLVWQVPGYQPMGDLLGQEDAKLRAEFANPGYVACVLLGRVKATRVPVVFRAQAAAALNPDFQTQISPY